MLTDSEKQHLDEQGYLILENVISVDEADTMRNLALELAQDDIKAGRDYSHIENARRVWNLVNKHEVFEQAIQHPRIIEAQQYLLGEDLVLSSFTANIIGPGTPAGNLHIDFPLGNLPTPRPSFPLSANSVWFLDDFYPKNGSTRCVPGSHKRLDTMPKRDQTYPDEIQVKGPKGSVMILNGATWHGSGANQTDRERVGLLGFYNRSILKTQQDQMRLATKKVLNRATPLLRQLLGFNARPTTRV